jgi:hypothetical protein
MARRQRRPRTSRVRSIVSCYRFAGGTGQCSIRRLVQNQKTAGARRAHAGMGGTVAARFSGRHFNCRRSAFGKHGTVSVPIRVQPHKPFARAGESDAVFRKSLIQKISRNDQIISSPAPGVDLTEGSVRCPCTKRKTFGFGPFSHPAGIVDRRIHPANGNALVAGPMGAGVDILDGQKNRTKRKKSGAEDRAGGE